MRSIDIYLPPIEPFVIWRGGFTKEECESIRQVGELISFAAGRIGDSNASTENPDIRVTDVAWIQPVEGSKWIFDKMNSLIGRINFDKFQMQLDRFDGFQYSKYEPGAHYDWHVDTTNSPRSGLFRKLSLVLFLSDPAEYKGGELLLNNNGNQENSMSLKPEMGDLIVFYSHVPHKVVPVSKGLRLTLVTWALGGKLQ